MYYCLIIPKRVSLIGFSYPIKFIYMNTIDLINKLAVNHNITTGRAEMIVSILIERLVEKLKKDGEIKIANFGTFSIRRKEPGSDLYMKRNEPIPMARNHVTFFPDKIFLENINSQ